MEAEGRAHEPRIQRPRISWPRHFAAFRLEPKIRRRSARPCVDEGRSLVRTSLRGAPLRRDPPARRGAGARLRRPAAAHSTHQDGGVRSQPLPVADALERLRRAHDHGGPRPRHRRGSRSSTRRAIHAHGVGRRSVVPARGARGRARRARLLPGHGAASSSPRGPAMALAEPAVAVTARGSRRARSATSTSTSRRCASRSR